jgi:FkbM family methyltransferase
MSPREVNNMYTKMEIWKEKLRNLAWRLFSKLENNGNGNFDENGEFFFIKKLIEFYYQSEEKKITLFDIGANIGEYSEILLNESKKYPLMIEMHLFEPTKSCFCILEDKFSNNKSVILNNIGASSENCESIIYYDKEQSGLASLYNRNLDTYNITLSYSETVKLQKISTYIKDKNITHIHFIKIDIEGHELRALYGFDEYLNANFIDYVQFEYGGTNLDSHTSLLEFYTLLEKRNFSIAKIMPDGLLIRNYKPWMDNFTYANYVAVSNRVIQK